MLVVDDEQVVQNFTKRVLDESYQVFTAGNGDEAWHGTNLCNRSGYCRHPNAGMNGKVLGAELATGASVLRHVGLWPVKQSPQLMHGPLNRSRDKPPALERGHVHHDP